MSAAGWEPGGTASTACRERTIARSNMWRPVNDTSEAAWEHAKKYLIDTHRALLDAIAQLDEARLNEPIIVNSSTPFSTVYVTLHGGVQHDLYHAGQIAILKKAFVNL